MGIFKRAAAIGIAAALTASMSVAAYAQDVTDTGAPLELTAEGYGSAEGYEEETKAFFKYYENTDVEFYVHDGDGFKIEDVLTDETMITVNSGSVDLSAAKYGYFELFKFSEDKSTLVLEETIVIHSHMATRDYLWSIDGTLPGGTISVAIENGYYEAADPIDGCGIAICSFGDITVVGNKISGNLIRQLVDQSYDYNYRDDYKTPHNLNDYDLINVCAYYETEEDNGRHMFLPFLTDS